MRQAARRDRLRRRHNRRHRTSDSPRRSSYTYYNYYGGGVYRQWAITMTGGSIVGCSRDGWRRRVYESADRSNGPVLDDRRQQHRRVRRLRWRRRRVRLRGRIFLTCAEPRSSHDCRCGGGGGGGVRALRHVSDVGPGGHPRLHRRKRDQKVYGGGVYVASSSGFEMSGQAKIEDCQAISTSSSTTPPSAGASISKTILHSPCPAAPCSKLHGEEFC